MCSMRRPLAHLGVLEKDIYLRESIGSYEKKTPWSAIAHAFLGLQLDCSTHTSVSLWAASDVEVKPLALIGPVTCAQDYVLAIRA